MHLVAITRLATSIEEEAKALAHDLGTLPYEQRLRLAVGVPAVVLSTPDDRRASVLVEALGRRGHDVMRCLASDVVAMDDMVELRRFRFEPTALAATIPAARLRWADVAVLIRAIHRTTNETRDVVTKKQFSLGRAALTGGLVSSKTTTRATIGHVDDKEGVLYIFLRTAGPPWILREQRAHFDALGADVGLSSAHNFLRMVDQFRMNARQAAFDDRLVARKGTSTEIDPLAHLIAGSIAAGVTPFR